MASSPLSLASGPVAFNASSGKRPAQHSPWSWHVGRLFGIDARVHATFLMLLAWVGLSHLMHGHDVRIAAAGVVYVVAVFAIIVLHELGHALTARHFGFSTRDITLLPIGGVARLERMPTEPSQELLVALAGPAVAFRTTSRWWITECSSASWAAARRSRPRWTAARACRLGP